MTTNLFGNTPEESVSVADDGLDITYWATFLGEVEANGHLQQLLSETEWQQPSIWMFGRLVKTPRLTAWYGDENAAYKYSGIVNKPMPWTPTLSKLRQFVEMATLEKYNSVLLNFYRNGNDHLSWHSDDEVELGDEPVIASLSLGSSRTFCLRKKSLSSIQKRLDLVLPNGSLLCMRGTTQSLWEHCLKKEPKGVEPRINLTFRTVTPKRN